MSHLFTNVLQASFYGSIVIALVFVLRLVLKKAPRWTICLLWLLAAIRLLFPFDIPSSISLQPDMAQLQQIQSEITQDPIGQAAPIEPDNVVFPDRDNVQIVIQDNAVMEEVHRVIDWNSIAALVWVIMASGMALYSVLAYLRLRYRVREAVKVYDNVYECSGLDTAFVLGYLWPRIYIPMGLQNPKYIVDHERAHIRRGDHWFKLLMFGALAIHWFNPLVWAAYLCTCKDLEMACDERVVRDMSLDQRKAYSAALLACSASHRTFAACPVAFGEVSVKSRILGVLNYRRPRFWICLIAVLAIVFVAVCFLTTPEQEKEIPEQGNTISTDPEDLGNPSLSTKIYTYEELIALPGDKLLNLFIENGLEINDELKSTFTEDELQELFKTEFEALHMGISSRSASMYFDLAEKTMVVYEKITRPIAEQEAIENSMDDVKQEIQERNALERCKTALENLQVAANCYMTGRNEFYLGEHLNSETQVEFYLSGNEWLRIADVSNGTSTHKHLYLDGVLYNHMTSNGPSTQTPEWMIVNTESAGESTLWPFEYVWNPNAVLVSAESEADITRITVKVNEPVSVSGMVMETHTLVVCLDEVGDLRSIMISNREDPANADWNGIRMMMEVVSTEADASDGILEECRQQVDGKFHNDSP